MNLRVGFGIDVHRLEKSNKLIIGGIQIASELGAVGHSDADVLIHVICDALLGAANMRDIGFHFSDKDPKYKGIDSKILLKDVIELIKGKGFSVGNIDCTICLQEPKVNPYVPEMKSCLAKVIDIPEEDVSIKATTTEKLGFVGTEEGVSAHAVALIYKTDED